MVLFKDFFFLSYLKLNTAVLPYTEDGRNIKKKKSGGGGKTKTTSERIPQILHCKGKKTNFKFYLL